MNDLCFARYVIREGRYSGVGLKAGWISGVCLFVCLLGSLYTNE